MAISPIITVYIQILVLISAFINIYCAIIYTGCQLDFVKKKVFLKGLIFKKKGFCNKKKGFPCQMDSFLIPAKGFFTSCILK